MKSLRSVSIGVRLAVGFGLVLLLLALVGGFGLSKVKQVQSHAHALGTNWLPSVEALATLRATANEVRRTSMRHVLEETAQGKHAQTAILEKDVLTVMPAQLGAYEKLVSSEEERALFQDIRVKWDAFLGANRKLLALSDAGPERIHEAREMATGLAGEKFAEVMSAITRAIEANVEGGRNATALAEAAYENAFMSLLGMMALAAVVGASLAWAITRSVVVPLHSAVHVAQCVAAGDLTAEITIAGNDEATELLLAMGEMNDRLLDVVGRVRQSSDSIATGSTEIAAGSADLSARTEQQASSLEETAASMEQLTATVRTNAETAHQAHLVASSASKSANEGGESVSRVAATMQEISQASQQIAEITKVIDGIAFQTNILALNAAVEAARAGEQGRGFAVVAGEVRILAQRAGVAAKEIKELIDANLAKVEQGAGLARTAGEQMVHIVEQVQNVGTLIGDIANASKEQAAGIRQVGEAVNQLDQVTQQNAALVEESSAAADSLRQQVLVLAQVVATFQLRDQQEYRTRAYSEPPLPVSRSTPALPRSQAARGQERGRLRLAPVAVQAAGGTWTGF